METKEIRFRDPAHFLSEYESHLKHGGYFIQLQPTPSIHTEFKLVLYTFPDQTPILFDAVVVTAMPQGVGLQFTNFAGPQRLKLEHNAELCRSSVQKANHQSHETPFQRQDKPLPSATKSRFSATSGTDYPSSQTPTSTMHAKPQAPTSTMHAKPRDIGTDSIRPRFQEASGTGDAHSNARTSSNFARDNLPRVPDSIQRNEPSESIPPDHEMTPENWDNYVPTPSQDGIWSIAELPDISYYAPISSPTNRDTVTSEQVPVIESHSIHHSVKPRQVAHPQSPTALSDHSSHRPSLGMSEQHNLPQHASPPNYPTMQAAQQVHNQVQYAPAPRAEPTPTTPSMIGTLGEYNIQQLLVELSEKRETGLLQIECPNNQIDTYFYKGKIVCVEEKPANEASLIGKILVAENNVQIQDVNKGLDYAKTHNMPLGEALNKLKLLTKRDLAVCLRKQMQMRLGAVYTNSEGRYEFWDKRLPRDRALSPPTSPLKLLFRHHLSMLTERLFEEAKKVEDSYLDEYVFPLDDAKERLDELGFNKEEEYFWNNMITGRFRLRKIYAASNFRRRRSHALIFALRDFDFLEFRSDKDRVWQESEMRQFFEDRYKLVGDGSLFELLGLHWTESRLEIERAYKRVRREYDIERIGGEWPEDICKMSKAIIAFLESAYNKLHTDRSRREYRSDVYESSKIEFSVELFIEQGDMAIFRKNYEEAIDRYSRALEIDPDLSHIREKIAKLRTIREQQIKAQQIKAQQAQPKTKASYEDALKIKWNEEDLRQAAALRTAEESAAEAEKSGKKK